MPNDQDAKSIEELSPWLSHPTTPPGEASLPDPVERDTDSSEILEEVRADRL